MTAISVVTYTTFVVMATVVGNVVVASGPLVVVGVCATGVVVVEIRGELTGVVEVCATGVVVVETTGELTGVVEVDWGATVAEALWQLNETLWTLMVQGGASFLALGSWQETFLAPPHWLFWTCLTLLPHDSVCLQVEPSSIS